MFVFETVGVAGIRRFVISHLGRFDMATCPKFSLLVIFDLRFSWPSCELKKTRIVGNIPQLCGCTELWKRCLHCRLKAWNSHPSPSRSSSRPMTSEVFVLLTVLGRVVRVRNWWECFRQYSRFSMCGPGWGFQSVLDFLSSNVAKQHRRSTAH